MLKIWLLLLHFATNVMTQAIWLIFLIFFYDYTTTQLFVGLIIIAGIIFFDYIVARKISSAVEFTKSGGVLFHGADLLLVLLPLLILLCVMGLNHVAARGRFEIYNLAHAAGVIMIDSGLILERICLIKMARQSQP